MWGWGPFPLPKKETLDDRQITHLICVRLKHLLYARFRGVFWASFLLFVLYEKIRPKTPPPLKSHIANGLGGHRLAE